MKKLALDRCLSRHARSVFVSLLFFFIVIISELPLCRSVISRQSVDHSASGSTARRNNTRSGVDGMCGACWTREERKEYDRQVFQDKILRKLRMGHPPDISTSVRDVHLVPSIQNIINALEKEDRSRRSAISLSTGGRHCEDGRTCSSDQHLAVEDEDVTVEPNTDWQNERLSGDGESSTVFNAFHLAENVVPNDPSVLKFDLSKYSEPDLVISAVLGVYVESQHKQSPHTQPSYSSSRNHGPAIVITLYRRVASSTSHRPGSYQNEFIQKGRRKFLRQIHNKWQTFNVTQQVMDWIRHPNTNHGLTVEVLDRRRPLNVLDLNCSNTSAHRPYLELQFVDPDSIPPSLRPHSRARRTVMSQDCRDNTSNAMCCRYALTLDFAKIGWDWVIAPQRTSAYYCSGQCPYLYQIAIPATHTGRQTGLLPGAPCCAPTKTSDLQIMYLDANGTIIQSTVPGLIIEKCGCW
jgi:hypothetical protein